MPARPDRSSDGSVSPLLLALSRRRWNVPVLAYLRDADAMPFGELSTVLGASREALSGSLTALREPGWIARGEGRRGGYRLAPAGVPLATPCAGVVSAAEVLGLGDLAFRRWTLPVIAALRGGELRFAELRVLLPRISPRALTLALKDMQERGLVLRRVAGGFPPATAYRLTDEAAALREPVERIAGLE